MLFYLHSPFKILEFIQKSNLTDILMKTFAALQKKLTLSPSIINGEPKFSKLQFVKTVYNTTRKTAKSSRGHFYRLGNKKWTASKKWNYDKEFHFHEIEPHNYYIINYSIMTWNSLLWLKIWTFNYFLFHL